MIAFQSHFSYYIEITLNRWILLSIWSIFLSSFFPSRIFQYNSFPLMSIYPNPTSNFSWNLLHIWIRSRNKLPFPLPYYVENDLDSSLRWGWSAIPHLIAGFLLYSPGSKIHLVKPFCKTLSCVHSASCESYLEFSLIVNAIIHHFRRNIRNWFYLLSAVI